MTAARTTDPATSHAAAARAARTAPTLREQCLAALRALGPMTDFELAEAVERLQTSAGVRRCELVRAGLVVPAVGDNGKQIRRPSPSGSPALVWRAA